MKPGDPGWIYIVRQGTRIKVGKTTDHRKRMKEAKTWLPDIEEVGAKPFWNVSQTERVLHAGLSMFWYHNEWFDFQKDEYFESFLEEFSWFSDDDRDKNTYDFPRWINSSGMAEHLRALAEDNISLKKFLRQESFTKKAAPKKA